MSKIATNPKLTKFPLNGKCEFLVVSEGFLNEVCGDPIRMIRFPTKFRAKINVISTEFWRDLRVVKI